MFVQKAGRLIKDVTNLAGWHTNRHLVILESDDWGSIRMPSAEVFNSLKSDGIDLESDEGSRYNRYDSIATSEDLQELFEVLHTVKDGTGRSVVMTPVAVVANPDFSRIRENGYREYFYESIDETMKRYPGCESSFTLWREGIRNRLFVPQFHGREHLNVKIWLRAIQRGDERTLTAFRHGMWGISTASDPLIAAEFQAAFDFVDPEDLKYQREVIVDGLGLFEKLFGYKAAYFVPPNGPFSSDLEQVCVANGIKLLSVPRIQHEPLGFGKYSKRYHWLGKKGSTGIVYLPRNCFFEPVEHDGDSVRICMEGIGNAFRWRKPAIISSHRVNYVGAIDRKNRERGLGYLSELLNAVISKWPDAEFITTGELTELICNED